MSQEKIDNFVIRRAEPEDFRELQRIHELPRASWGTLQLPYPSAQNWRKRLEKQVGDHYALVACARDLIVGSLGLVVPERSPAPRPRRLDRYGRARPVAGSRDRHGAAEGRRRARGPLAELEPAQLTAFVDNDVALRLYRKFGFEIEGLLRRYAFRDGAYVDAYTLARLR